MIEERNKFISSFLLNLREWNWYGLFDLFESSKIMFVFCADVPFYGVYCNFATSSNRDLIHTLNSVYSELETVQRVIRANNLSKSQNIKSRIKISKLLMRKLEKHSKKRGPDSGVSLILRELKTVTVNNSNEKLLSIEYLYKGTAFYFFFGSIERGENHAHSFS